MYLTFSHFQNVKLLSTRFHISVLALNTTYPSYSAIPGNSLHFLICFINSVPLTYVFMKLLKPFSKLFKYSNQNNDWGQYWPSGHIYPWKECVTNMLSDLPSNFSLISVEFHVLKVQRSILWDIWSIFFLSFLSPDPYSPVISFPPL